MILMDKSVQDSDLRVARQQELGNGVLPNLPTDTDGAREVDRPVDRQGAGGADPKMLLPDVQSASEARAWAERLAEADSRVILWVDSLWGTFDSERIVDELKSFVTGACCDADGFLWRFIEAFQLYPEFVLPDRDDMNDTTHFLRSFRRFVAGVCARRGIPFHDPNGAERGLEEVRVEAADLLLVPRGRITERGMRRNIRAAVTHLVGEEDTTANDETALLAASAARLAAAQLWQWVRHETGVLDVGRIVTPMLFESLLEEELGAMGGGQQRIAAAEALSATVLCESFTMHAFCDTATGPAQQ